MLVNISCLHLTMSVRLPYFCNVTDAKRRMHRTDKENEMFSLLRDLEIDHQKFLVLQQLLCEGWEMEQALEELKDVNDSLALELIHKGMTKREAFYELNIKSD